MGQIFEKLLAGAVPPEGFLGTIFGVLKIIQLQPCSFSVKMGVGKNIATFFFKNGVSIYR